MYLAILNIINSIVGFFKKNPKFFLGVIFAILISLFLKQCSSIRELKHEIKVKDVEYLNEQNRFQNNIKNLKDSVEYHIGQEVYTKTLLRVKDGELERLDNDLYSYKNEVSRLANTIQKNSKIKNIYITEISSEIDKHDVMTNTMVDSLGNFSIGISDSNEIISINTETWFKLSPDNDKLKISFVDKFGEDKVSRLQYNLNFSLGLSQVELENGNTRIMVQPRDINGEPIPSNILSIPFVNGVDFMDVEPVTIPSPSNPKNRRGFGVMVGPSYGLYQINGTFQPTWGIGVSVGYKLF